LSGTAMDENEGGRVAVSSFSIRDNTIANGYWNGSTFSGVSEQFFPLTFQSGTVWSTGVPMGLVSGRTYEVRFRAVDKAGNVEPLRNLTTFYYDNTSPSVRFEFPMSTNVYLNSVPQIAGTASDVAP